MSRLPVPGSDDGTWGAILNDFLEVEHSAAGLLKKVSYLSGAGKTTVSDSDFSFTPTNGSLAVVRNSTDDSSLLFMRSNASWKDVTAALSAHLTDTTAAHAASAISFTPTGSIASTDVQAAIAEVASEAVAAATPWINAKDEGALGNGTTDDSSAINTALAAAAAGTLLFPPGTYIHTNITVPANTTIILMRGATLKMKASSSTHGLLFANSGSTLLGPGSLDGNRASQSSNVMPIYVTAANVRIDGVTITASKYHGVHGQTCSGLTVTGCNISNVAQTGINVDASAANVSDIEVSFNRVDRSAENPSSGVGDAGIYLYADAPGGEIITRGRIIGNDVSLPTNPTYAMGGVVTSHVRGATVSDNTVKGGQLGISIDSSDRVTVSANSVFGSSNIGLELAASTSSSLDGNTVNGNDLTQYGISVTNTGPISNSVTGNTATNCSTRTLRAVDADYLSVTGNTFTHSAASALSEFTTTQHFTFSSNTCYGSGTATRAVLLSVSDRCVIVGNNFYSFAADAIKIEVTTAVAIDYLTIIGNTFVACQASPVVKALSGGATMGSHALIMGSPGYNSTYNIDVIDLNSNVLRASGAGTPEGNLIAGVGSTFQRNNGATNTSLYVKELGTGNTGWRPLSSAPEIDFISEYGGVRSNTTGGEAANATAFANLIADLQAGTTRRGIRVIDFGPADGTAFWLNTTVELQDFDGVTFKFRSGPTFNESIGGNNNFYFMWSGAANTYMFRLTISASGTTQAGLQWDGFWNMLTNTNQRGWGMYISDINNWGGPASGLGFGNNGGSGSLQRGIVLGTQFGDNAHGNIGKIMSCEVGAGAIYCLHGGFYVDNGNISVTTGQTGVYLGPDCSEMKIGAGVKFDGGGAFAIDCYGSDCEFDGFNIEGFDSGVGIRVRRDVTGGNSGRRCAIRGVHFTGSSGGQIPWIFEDMAGGGMFGNSLMAPHYSNCLDPNPATNDTTMLPGGSYGIFDVCIDYYRFANHGNGPTNP